MEDLLTLQGFEDVQTSNKEEEMSKLQKQEEEEQLIMDVLTEPIPLPPNQPNTSTHFGSRMIPTTSSHSLKNLSPPSFKVGDNSKNFNYSKDDAPSLGSKQGNTDSYLTVGIQQLNNKASFNESNNNDSISKSPKKMNRNISSMKDENEDEMRMMEPSHDFVEPMDTTTNSNLPTSFSSTPSKKRKFEDMNHSTSSSSNEMESSFTPISPSKTMKTKHVVRLDLSFIKKNLCDYTCDRTSSLEIVQRSFQDIHSQSSSSSPPPIVNPNPNHKPQPIILTRNQVKNAKLIGKLDKDIGLFILKIDDSILVTFDPCKGQEVLLLDELHSKYELTRTSLPSPQVLDSALIGADFVSTSSKIWTTNPQIFSKNGFGVRARRLPSGMEILELHELSTEIPQYGISDLIELLKIVKNQPATTSFPRPQKVFNLIAARAQKEAVTQTEFFSSLQAQELLNNLSTKISAWNQTQTCFHGSSIFERL